ncbi:response regulator [Sulfidibacter corallicola]|uniref:histidine kinase n=1 Tax=Sulfidibacter corallicola TaxID=2818388 RepID=A0A8A4TLN2_SULCO|nr:response regulator [Sulfidibacter corallicola]QTD50377.1 response regulator [Sulfidibacter corallicola]
MDLRREFSARENHHRFRQDLAEAGRQLLTGLHTYRAQGERDPVDVNRPFAHWLAVLRRAKHPELRTMAEERAAGGPPWQTLSPSAAPKLDPDLRDMLILQVADAMRIATRDLPAEVPGSDAALEMRLRRLIRATFLMGFVCLGWFLSAWFHPFLKLRRLVHRLSAGGGYGSAGSWDFSSLTRQLDRLVHDRSQGSERTREEDIARSINDGLAIISPEGRIRTVNNAFCRMLGYEEQELLGRAFDSIYVQHQTIKVQGFFKRRDDSQVEELFQTKAGDIIPVRFTTQFLFDGDHRVQGVLCLTRDISREKEYEEELQRHTEWLRGVLCSIDEAVITTAVNGGISFINPHAERLTGFKLSEALDKPVDTVFRLKGEKQGDPVAFLENLVAFKPLECVLIDRKGRERIIDESVAHIRAAEGTSYGMIIIFRDVTEHRIAAQELLAAKEAAEDASAAKSIFLARMSDEIRTPIQTIIEMNQMLLGAHLNREQHKLAEIVRRSAESLQAVINDVLDFSTMEAGRLELNPGPLEIRTLVEEIGDMMAPTARAKNLTFLHVIEPKAPSQVMGDLQRIRQVLVNLVENALKFTERGQVVVYLDRLTRNDPEVQVLAREAEMRRESEPSPIGPRGAGTAYLRFRVRDTGAGIKTDDLDRYFQAFTDTLTPTPRGGTGLGLAICKRLTEAMGGRLEVESELGEGATFSVLLPLPVVSEIYPPEPLPWPKTTGSRLLILTNRDISREFFGKYLTYWDCHWEAIDDADKVVSCLEEASVKGAPYAAAVLDMDGQPVSSLELLRSIRTSPDAAATPLLMTTTRPIRPHTAKALVSGVVAYLNKPLKADHLRAGLELAALQWRDVDRLATRHPLPAKPRILVADPSPTNQKLIGALIAAADVACHTVSDGYDALAEIEHGSFDLVLIDCHMPVVNGLETTRKIREREGPLQHTPIVGTTFSGRPRIRDECYAAGMDAVLEKPISAHQLHNLFEQFLPQGEALRKLAEYERKPYGGPEELLHIGSVCGKNRALEQELVEIAMVEVQDHLTSLEQALESGTGTQLRTEADHLEDIVANLNAQKFRDAVHLLARAIRENDREHWPYRMDQVKKEFVLLRTYLFDYLSRRTTEPADDSFPGDTVFRVLIVDDEKMNRVMVQHYLSGPEFAVDQAADGQEALDLILAALNASEQAPYDLILLDVLMPNMSGFEVCNHIRRHYPPHELPVLMLTAKGQLADIIKGFEAGANDYLVKPVKKELLLSRIRLQLNLLKANRRLEEYNQSLEDQVADRTAKLRLRNAELETLDRIVIAINREFHLSNLLPALLHQGMELFPSADQALFLIWDAAEEQFRVAATAAIPFERVAEIRLTRESLGQSFFEGCEQVEKGIFINSHVERFATFGNARKQPRSVLAMALELEGHLEGLLVLDNLHEKQAFSQSDVQKLARFQHHAVTALAKTHYHLELEKKTREILANQKQLMTQEKMASLGTMTAGVAHELRNPLNFINNLAEVLEEDTKALSESFRALTGEQTHSEVTETIENLNRNAAIIARNGRRAERIIDSMMLLSRSGSGKRREVNINALLEEYSFLASQGIRGRDLEFNPSIVTRFDPDVTRINATPESLSRAFLNLMNNALYALRQKRRRLGERFTPELRLVTRPSEEGVEVWIEDNGDGIPESVVNRIFTPFFTTKPPGEGAGLGLALCYDIIVSEHGGDIRIDTEPGSYTRFRVKLPRDPQAAVVDRPEEKPTSSMSN